jgi:SAM-dependent methyltransferase
MDPEYGRRYADLYRRHWWWRARGDAVLEQIRRVRHREPATRILDVGCGDGLFFDALAPFGSVHGVEPDERLLSPRSPWRDRITISTFGDGFRPPHRYGLILFLDVLEHMPDPTAALIRARQLLEPDGAIVVTVPAFEWLWTSHDDLNHHQTRYTRTELRRVARTADLQVTYEQYLFQWLVPAKLLTRAWEALRHPAPAPPCVPPHLLNALLFGYSRFEMRMARALGVPFGGTLLAIITTGAHAASGREHPRACEAEAR